MKFTKAKYCIFVKWLIVAITCNLNMKSKSLPCVAEIWYCPKTNADFFFSLAFKSWNNNEELQILSNCQSYSFKNHRNISLSIGIAKLIDDMLTNFSRSTADSVEFWQHTSKFCFCPMRCWQGKQTVNCFTEFSFPAIPSSDTENPLSFLWFTTCFIVNMT